MELWSAAHGLFITARNSKYFQDGSEQTHHYYKSQDGAPSMEDYTILKNCTICPRECQINRYEKTGFCKETVILRASRAALHFWEEPIISGKGGSGAVFFSGCNMRCVFCQNYNIATAQVGKEISVERLADIFFELEEKGAHNINLVTPSHFILQIKKAITLAKNQGLSLPIVYNTSSYEKVDTLRQLDGLVDIYLPDLKYYSTELSSSYSSAPDYFSIASNAIAEMFRQVGTPQLSSDGLLQKGLIVRHLLLPGQSKDTKKVLRYLHETYGDQIYISIMNQYTPMPQVTSSDRFPELHRKVTEEEYHKILTFSERLGISQGFYQEGETAEESFIPAFDYEGI